MTTPLAFEHTPVSGIGHHLEVISFHAVRASNRIRHGLRGSGKESVNAAQISGQEALDSFPIVSLYDAKPKSQLLQAKNQFRKTFVQQSGIASQLVNLVANGVVKPFRHVAPDELNRGHAADLV